MNINLLGDSIADGTGASDDAHKWRNMLAAIIGTITNYAHGGDMVGDQLAKVLAINPSVGDKSIIQLGVNDQRIYGESAMKQAYYIDGLRSLIAWLALGSKQTARSVGGETGSWSNTGILGIGRATTSVGSIKTFTVSGTTVYLAMLLADSAGMAGTYDVRIDGVTWQSFDSIAPGITSYNGYPYSERLHRFPGLAAGSHTIEVKMTGPSNVYVQWAAGNMQTVFPEVFVNNIIRPFDYTWGGSLANIQSYNAGIAQIVSELRADGLDVTLVDLYSALDPATDIHSDKLHANDSGNAKIAVADMLAICGPITYTPKTVYAGSDGNWYAGDSATKVRIATIS